MVLSLRIRSQNGYHGISLWSCYRTVTRSCAGTSFRSRRRKDSTPARRSTNSHGMTRLTTTDWTGTPLGRLPPPHSYPSVVMYSLCYAAVLSFWASKGDQLSVGRFISTLKFKGIYQTLHIKDIFVGCRVARLLGPHRDFSARVRCARAASHPRQVVC